jgi:hypothetical protein
VLPVTDSAERRQLTVLFCDLGSTRLAAGLDPEDWRDVVRRYQEAAAAVVGRFDGHVAQYLGDGILAYFGWPRAHEDDAERAVRAGLALVDAVEDPLRVRIGIHTGPVVVGEMGGGECKETLALGDTTNVAARLQGIADPGAVVLSDATSTPRTSSTRRRCSRSSASLRRPGSDGQPHDSHVELACTGFAFYEAALGGVGGDELDPLGRRAGEDERLRRDRRVCAASESLEPEANRRVAVLHAELDLAHAVELRQGRFGEGPILRAAHQRRDQLDGHDHRGCLYETRATGVQQTDRSAVPGLRGVVYLHERARVPEADHSRSSRTKRVSNRSAGSRSGFTRGSAPDRRGGWSPAARRRTAESAIGTSRATARPLRVTTTSAPRSTSRSTVASCVRRVAMGSCRRVMYKTYISNRPPTTKGFP